MRVEETVNAAAAAATQRRAGKVTTVNSASVLMSSAPSTGTKNAQVELHPPLCKMTVVSFPTSQQC